MKVLLFVQTGRSRPKPFQTWRTGGASGTKRAPQRQPVPSGEYIATRRADYWMSLAAFRAFSKAERWWLVECENAETGRYLIAHLALNGTPARALPYGLDGIGRILAAWSLRSWVVCL